MSILDQILAEKEKEISHIAKPDAEVLLRDAAEKSPAPRGFAAALCAAAPPAVIAEIKRASPSRGIIREDLSPIGAASAFAGNGAACLSVLTDEKFFAGKLDFLREIRR
ncbi:MAG TPA: indole-3-glycerol-phosphate synthase TrpC, partial [Oligoflexia bacterium]|nr:indole-3-glycerol-phosphate synthase TrpC [Oligoflexia bacterium]